MKRLVAPIGLALLAVALPALAQQPAPTAAPAPAAATAPSQAPAPGALSPAAPHGQGPTAMEFVDRTLGSLNLTPEQQAQIAPMRQSFETSTEGLRADARARFVEVRKLRGTQGTDPAVLEAKRAELAEVQAKLRGEFDKFYAQVDGVLDPAQREKLAQIRASLRESSQPPATLPAPKAAGSTPPGHG